MNIVGKIWDNLLFCWEECEGVIVGYFLVMLVQVGVDWLSCALMILYDWGGFIYRMDAY